MKRYILIITTIIFSIFIFSGCSKKSDGTFSGFKKDIFSFSFKQEPRYVIDNDNVSAMKYGYIDKKGKIVIPFKYIGAEHFENGVAIVTIEKDGNSYKGLIDVDGKYIIQPEYKDIGTFKENLAWVNSEGKEGYVNKKGEFVIWPKFDTAYDFSEGLARISEEGSVGFINKKGEYIILPKYKNASDYKNGYTIVEDYNGKYMLLNRSGKVKKNLDFDDIYLHYTNDNDTDKLDLYIVMKKDKYGVINAKGEQIIEPKYDDIGLIGDGKYITFKQKDKYGIMTRKSTILFPPQFTSNITFKDGYFICDKPDGNSFIYNENGKLIFKTENYIGFFAEGLLIMRDNKTEMLTYITPDGKQAFKKEFDVASPFQDGAAFVRRSDSDNMYIGFINKTGEFFFKRTYKIEKPVYNNYYEDGYNYDYEDNYDYNDNYY